MKRYRFLFLLLAALSMTSCLDEHPKDQLDEDAIYGSHLIFISMAWLLSIII